MSSVEQPRVKRSGLGLRACDRGRVSEGFTLFAPLSGNGKVYLIDLGGEVVHTWQMPYPPGNYGYLTERGTFSTTAKHLRTRHGTSAIKSGKAARHWKPTGTAMFFGKCAIQTITTMG